jgi:hypothetical protein
VGREQRYADSYSDIHLLSIVGCPVRSGPIRIKGQGAKIGLAHTRLIIISIPPFKQEHETECSAGRQYYCFGAAMRGVT